MTEIEFNICPYVKIGDTVSFWEHPPMAIGDGMVIKSFIIRGFQYDDYTKGCCGAYKELALAHNSDKTRWWNPGNTVEVDCDKCTVAMAREDAKRKLAHKTGRASRLRKLAMAFQRVCRSVL